MIVLRPRKIIKPVPPNQFESSSLAELCDEDETTEKSCSVLINPALPLHYPSEATGDGKNVPGHVPKDIESGVIESGGSKVVSTEPDATSMNDTGMEKLALPEPVLTFNDSGGSIINASSLPSCQRQVKRQTRRKATDLCVAKVSETEKCESLVLNTHSANMRTKATVPLNIKSICSPAHVLHKQRLLTKIGNNPKIDKEDWSSVGETQGCLKLIGKKRGRKPQSKQNVVCGKGEAQECGQIIGQKRGRRPTTEKGTVCGIGQSPQCVELIAQERKLKTENSVVSCVKKVGKKRGRNPKTEQKVVSGEGETQGCVRITSMRRKLKTEHDAVHGTGETRACEKPVEKKKGRKVGDGVGKNKISAGCCAQLDKMRTLHVRVQRLPLNFIPQWAEISTAHQRSVPLQESEYRQEGGATKTEDRNDATDVTCLKKNRRSPRQPKLCGFHCCVSEQGTKQDRTQQKALCSTHNCSFTVTDQAHTVNGIKCMRNPLLDEAKNRESKCSYGCSQSLTFLNPVVKLRNCSNMKRLIRCSNLRVSSPRNENTCPAATVEEPDPQKQLPSPVYTVNSVVGTDSSIGGNNSKELQSITNGLANRKIKRILKVKWDFGKKTSNSTTCFNEHIQRDSAMSVKQKTKDLKCSSNHSVNTESSDPCTNALEKNIEEINNNKSDSVHLNLKETLFDQSPSQNKNESYAWPPIECRTTQLPLVVSKYEGNDRESLDLDCSAVIRMSVNEPVVGGFSDCSLTEEEANFVNNNHINECAEECKTCSCQRTIQFTGKTKWKSSCARTCVWAFPRKRASTLFSTDILGLDSELSLTPYPSDINSLFQSNAVEPLQSTIDDSEGICKKLKLDFISKNDPLAVKAIYDEGLPHPQSETPELPNTVIEEVCNVTESVHSLDEENRYENLDCWPCSSTIIESTINILTQPLLDDENVTSCPFSEIQPFLQTVDDIALSSSFENSEPSVYSRASSMEPDKSFLQSETVLKSIQHVSPIHECLDSNEANNNGEIEFSFFHCMHKTANDNTCLSEEHTTKQLDNTGGPLDDSNSSGLALTQVESPKKSKLMEFGKSSDGMKEYEDDVLFLDVVSDDPDLFGIPEEPYKSPAYNADNSENNKQNDLSALMRNLQEQESAKINKSTNDASPEENVEERSTYFAEGMTDLEVKNDPLIIPNSLEENSEDFYDAAQSDFEGFRGHLDLDREVKYAEKNSSESGSSLSFEESSSKDASPGSSHSHSRCWRRDTSHTYRPLHWMNDFRYSGKHMVMTDVLTLDQKEQWNQDNPFHDYKPIPKTLLPIWYCKYFFNTFRGCTKPNCLYQHVPSQTDEKVCMELIHKLVNENHTSLLRRAVWIFTAYYRMYVPGFHYDSNLLTKILHALYVRQMWGDVFHLLVQGAIVKILPSSEMLIKLFENIATAGLATAVPSLVDVFCKLVEAGMMLKPEEINMLIAAMNHLQATKNSISIILDIKTRIEMQLSKKNWLCNLDIAVAEVGHCKEKNDWQKLGTLYLNLRKGCENVTDLKKFSNCIVGALQKESKDDKSEVPYCDFADTVYRDAQLSEIDKNILGRIGISIMYHYSRNKLWQKGRKVLKKLQKMQIHFTVLNGLTGDESKATRCQVVNTAVEIFLNCKYLNGALWVLRADVDVSQYSLLFNKLLESCIENNTLGVSSNVIDFMVAKKIPVDFTLLRSLITSLGRSCLWLRARALYKCAVSLGCYPPMEGNLYRKVLLIPSFVSEIEMLLSIEIFMVSNASSIQSPGGSNQILQIILKRCEEERVQHKDYTKCKDDYQDAVGRLVQASRLSTPRLVIKHMTVNNANEQVYILDYSYSLKWLHENMKWAGKVWLFQ
ncbi:protein TOPAZ1 isoform X2 [Xenopus laevis]|uniref:Protein TOPAZ1 n=1 Tax=Xenopus laevis TaxID=8355 RepID=A0A8J1KXC6_XENLA|nr:protein TOPAZ1 isoform X2 [Xenopus laevis]